MGLWIGFLFIDGAWQAQPSTRSRDQGTCARRLDQLGEMAGVPCTHQIMTGGKMPRYRPVERPAPLPQPDLEGDDP